MQLVTLLVAHDASRVPRRDWLRVPLVRSPLVCMCRKASFSTTQRRAISS